jgi:hypothetical protein
MREEKPKANNDEGRHDVLIYKALLRLSKEVYLGNSQVDSQKESDFFTKRKKKKGRKKEFQDAAARAEREREQKIENELPKGIQRTLAQIQAKYGRACRAQKWPLNVFSAGGYQFFVDQENNYIVPDDKVGNNYEIKDGKILAKDRTILADYDYPGNPIPVPRLREIMLSLAGKSQVSPPNHRELTMFLAGMVAEPSRYSIAHITNLITLAEPGADKKESAFETLSMTQGGSYPRKRTDRRKQRNPEYDSRLKGMEKSTPKIVTDRDIAAVRNRKNKAILLFIDGLVKKYRNNERLIVSEIAHFIKKRLMMK